MGIIFDNQQTPYVGTMLVDFRTGRPINADLIDYQKRRDWGDPKSHLFQKRLYQVRHTRTAVAAGDVYYYSFTTPLNKDILFFSLAATTDEGPVTIDVLGANNWAPGSVLPIWKPFGVGTDPQSVFTSGVTNVTGPVTILSEKNYGAGSHDLSINNIGGALVGLRNASALIRVTNGGSGNNDVGLSVIWAEFDLSA